jgi:hypothetical protein
MLYVTLYSNNNSNSNNNNNNNNAPGLYQGLSGRGVMLTTHPHLAPRLKKE